MKVWEKLADDIGYNREMIVEICKTEGRCPAKIEAKHRLIGDKRLEKFCALGCSVICVDEYMDLILGGRRNVV